MLTLEGDAPIGSDAWERVNDVQIMFDLAPKFKLSLVPS